MSDGPMVAPAPASATASDSDAVWSLARPLPLHFEKQHLYADYHRAHYFYDRACFHVEPGGRLRFDRPLNLFPYRRWRELTDVDEFVVEVDYRGGSCRVGVLSYDGEGSSLVAAAHLAPSVGLAHVTFALPKRISGRFLFVQIDAEAATDIVGLRIAAAREPVRDVKLGIAITTFNRPDDVEAQVEILEQLAASQLEHQVFVIDNGSNLELTRRYANTVVVPSPNLGGAGGFTRGLTEIEAAGPFTHAMFMDDDAFCHPEAILRAAGFLRHAKDERLAFTGAMNYLHAPEVQYELGGRIAHYGVNSIRMDQEMNSLRAAFDNDVAETPAYGAWWCFIFPLRFVETLPFPFFVRGDDIAFSLQNRFTLATMPGLLAWQPSFDFKIGASTEYLAHRSFLAMPLIAEGAWDRRNVLGGVRHAFVSEVDGLRYPLAEAICHALEDVLTGPDFWANTANTLARLAELGRMEKAFTDESFLPDWIFRPHDFEHRRSTRWLRARFGHWNIPARLCFRRPALTHDMAPKRGQAAFRRGMVYMSRDGSRRMSCRRDWRWRRRVEQRFERLLAEYDRRFDQLSADYRAAGRDLQSPEAWTSRFAPRERKASRARAAV